MARSSENGRLSASELSQAALTTVEELTGYRPEAVTGLEWDGEFWRVTVDALELERIPNTTDLLGSYMEQRELPTGRRNPLPGRPETETNLADILERVLDKGIVIAGDIQINLLDIELLTIKLRLLIASVDRAREMGINWWEGDPALSLETLARGDAGDNGGGLQ